jgi:MerR family transcriptional regulator, thiopeptide resistance regulator
MSQADEYAIGDVARLAHVSVRTLHHYESVGLLRPSARTAAGHRRYSPPDLARLREILFYRELDFGLDEIAAMLADPAAGTDDRLRRRHKLLRERMARHEHLLAALEKEMEARAMGISLTPEEQFEIFGTDQVSGEWADEAEQRWGETDAWKQSQRRTAAYTKDDWIEIKREDDANRAAFAEALRAGLPATDPAVAALADAHRAHITKWFYDCPPELHRGLAEMYVADERFRRSYDDVAPGLAQYIHDAIVAG